MSSSSLKPTTMAKVSVYNVTKSMFKWCKSGSQYVFVCAGGTFALYSLICRYAKVNKLPNQQPADEQISSFRLKLPTPELERALSIKEALETKGYMKTLLLLLVLMGTSMIIGDGILTPAMSGESELHCICCNRVSQKIWIHTV